MDIKEMKTKTKDFVKQHKTKIVTVAVVTGSVIAHFALTQNAVNRNEVVRSELWRNDQDVHTLVLHKRNGRTRTTQMRKPGEI